MQNSKQANPKNLFVEKRGVLSTVLSYYSFYWKWKNLYLKLNKTTKKYWEAREAEFKIMHTLQGLDKKSILAARKMASTPNEKVKEDEMFIKLDRRGKYEEMLALFTLVDLPKYETLCVEFYDIKSKRILIGITLDWLILTT